MLKKLTAVLLTAGAFFAANAAPKVTISGKGADASFDTIQAAIDSVKDDGEYTISLPKGTYKEVLYYNGPATIKLSGQTTEKYGKDVIISEANDGDICLNKRADSAQKKRCIIEFEGTGNLILENLTVQNTFERGSVKGSNTQAETLGYDGSGFVAAYNCSFLSHQDTLRTTGKTWFYNCYVEGDTDFIWMESTGKVALFEECEINAVYDEKHTTKIAYVGAPRMQIGPTAGKGLVIYNSKLITDPRQKTYLGRTPWRAGYYNQIAYINTKADGIEKEIWLEQPLTAPGVPQNIIGWKMDSKTAKGLKLNTKNRADIIPEADVKNEFNGRNAIVNRYFDILSNKYRKDSDTEWDLNSLAAKSGWKVSKDKSSALAKGEQDKKIVYAFDGTTDNSALKLNGFAKEEGKSHVEGNAGDSITIPLSAKAIVKVTGYNLGTGTIKAGKQGPVSYYFSNGTTDSTLSKSYVVYENNSELSITADTKTYITKIEILPDDSLKFRPVTAIKVNTYKNRKQLQGKKTMQMSAVLTPQNPTNDEYTWSVSNPDAAEIDPNGYLTAKSVKEDCVIKVIATSKDQNGVKGEAELKILKPEEGAFSAIWLNSEATSTTLEGKSDDTSVASVSKAIPSKGIWAYNSGKITSDIAKGALSFGGYSEPVKGRDKVYIDFPITANRKIEITNIEVSYGNHGTSNMACQIMWLKNGNKGNIADDTDRQVRNTKKSYRAYPTVIAEKGETVTIRVILYGLNGTGDIPIPTGKSPTIGTVIINGRAAK
ncbi:pectinesterase family protein [uncultured Treponema sp.]|uniref:pectinesterase family protein n=1 Tax=uncultured Treponema sp. TaxID=162155 RepID=UPI00280B1D05|nr:pectinesterase family protein [uncultured Treponema sp.]